MSNGFLSWINQIKIRLEKIVPQVITDKEQFRLIK